MPSKQPERFDFEDKPQYISYRLAVSAANRSDGRRAASRAPATGVLPPSWQVLVWHQTALACCVLWFAVTWIMMLCHQAWPAALAWADGLFALFAAATTLCSLALRLPVQNVLSLAILLSLFSFVIEIVGTKTSLPFGPYVHTDNLGPRLFDSVSWPAPFLWLTVILTCRGVARLILRPWRKFQNYGLWMISLAALLAAILDAALQPFATQANHYWLWEFPATSSAWHHVPWTNFVGRFAVTACILAFATPWLINKQPSRQSIDFHPLIIWWLLQIYFATGNALHHLWPAVMVGLATSVIISFFAWRGTRW